MEESLLHDIMEVARPKLRRNPIPPMEDDPNAAFSQIPNGVLYLEDTRSYIHCKFETVGEYSVSEEFKNIYKHDMTFKQGFEHLSQVDVIKYMFYHEFDNEDWSRIILSRIHDGKFWMGDKVEDITAELIHDVTGLCNQGSISLNEKNVKKFVIENTKTIYNGRGVVISQIKQDDVRFVSKIMATKMCASSREDEIAAGFVHAAYKLCVEKVQVNLCEILRIQLTDNLKKIKKTKNAQFRFQSLITYMFFHLLKRFPFMNMSDWSSDKCTMEKITDLYKRHPFDKIGSSATLMIKTFQFEMRQRTRIPRSMVEKYKDNFFFMVDTDKTSMEAVTPRVMYVEPLGYEITEEMIEGYAPRILNSDIDTKCTRFGAYEENMKEVYKIKIEKAARKKVDIHMKEMLKETNMTPEEYPEAKQIAVEVRASGRSNVLFVQPLSMEVGPNMPTTVASPSAASMATPLETTPPAPSTTFDQPEESSEVSILSTHLGTATRRSSRLIPTVGLIEVKQESDPPKPKRAKEQTTGPSKKQKVLYCQESQKKRSQEEEVGAVKKMGGQIMPPQAQRQEEEGSSSRKKINWKPKIQNMNDLILKEGNLKKLLQYYHRYLPDEQRNLDVTIIQYMIKFKKPLLSIHGELPKEMYDRLNNTRLETKKEEKTLRDEIIRKCYDVKNTAQIKRIMHRLYPLVRDKMSVIRLMGGLKQEVMRETEGLVNQVLSDPINKAYIEEAVSATPSLFETRSEMDTPMIAAETPLTTTKEKVIGTTFDTPEQIETNSQINMPHQEEGNLMIGGESITVDTSEDPLANISAETSKFSLGNLAVENIVDHSSSSPEEEVQRNEVTEPHQSEPIQEGSQQEEGRTKLPQVTMAPQQQISQTLRIQMTTPQKVFGKGVPSSSLESILANVTSSGTGAMDEDDIDQLGLISTFSINKIIEKSKKAKSLQGTLGEVTNKLQSTFSIQVNETDPQKKAKKVMEEFDNQFASLAEVATIKAKTEHDATMFGKVCTNIKDDLSTLDTCIKELRKCLTDGKELYEKCAFPHTYLSMISTEIKSKENELANIVSELKNVDAEVIDLEQRISKAHDELSELGMSKDEMMKKFALLREHLSLKIDPVQQQLAECSKAKEHYATFAYTDLQAVQMASYDLCALISVTDSVKEAWKKGLNSLNVSFSDCISLLTKPLA